MRGFHDSLAQLRLQGNYEGGKRGDAPGTGMPIVSFRVAKASTFDRQIDFCPGEKLLVLDLETPSSVLFGMLSTVDTSTRIRISKRSSESTSDAVSGPRLRHKIRFLSCPKITRTLPRGYQSKAASSLPKLS